MQKYIVSAFLLVVFISLVALAIRVWLNRRGAQEQVLEQPSGPFDSETLESASGFYVATTFAGEPLNRVSAFGLGHRGKADFALSAEGISIIRQGENSFAIRKADISAISLQQGTIDRVVESEGLISIVWQLGQSSVETSLRIVDKSSRTSFYAALDNLASKEVKND
ncbi:MAG: hypothetical protein RL174_790 [Actinomycetota bacterium]|jgi:hypothetical protein